MSNVTKEKKLLRKKIICLRDELSVEERIDKSRRIKSWLLRLSEIQKAQNIFFYVSFRSEVCTHEMIKSVLGSGKIVTVPVTDMENRRLIPSRILDFNADLAPGAMGILEPLPEKIIPVDVEEIDVVITPGAVFCEQGWRIGYGGGFYDRFLEKNRKKSFAIAFELQLVESVPHEPEHDIAVDFIITEDRVIKCK